jgi:DNA polymerase-3 subunit alpha
MGIEVLVPDVNESLSDFSVRRAAGAPDMEASVRFGLSAVRNVGEGVVVHIVAAREEGGPFTDFYDFCDRVDPSVLNKRTIESLVKAGAFDSVGHPRQGLLFVYETIVETVLGRRRNEAEGQFDLFSAVDDPAPEAVVGHRTAIPDTEFPKSQRLAFEKEMLGLYVSEHPMMGAERALRKYVDCTLSDLREGREGEMKTVGGIVTALNRKYTKRGDLMGTLVLEDLGAALEVMVFPKTMAQYGHLLEDDAIVVVKGRLDVRDDMPKIIAMEITRPELAVDSGPPVRVKVRLNALSDAKVGRLKDILSEHPGDSPVFVHLESPEKTTVLRLGDDHLVDAGTNLYAELRILLGADCIT